MALREQGKNGHRGTLANFTHQKFPTPRFWKWKKVEDSELGQALASLKLLLGELPLSTLSLTRGTDDQVTQAGLGVTQAIKSPGAQWRLQYMVR